MSMRCFRALSTAATVLLAGWFCQVAGAESPRSPVHCPHSPGCPESAAAEAHGSLSLGADRTGTITFDIIPAPGNSKCQRIHEHFPLGAICPVLGTAIGVPAEAVGWYFVLASQVEEWGPCCAAAFQPKEVKVSREEVIRGRKIRILAPFNTLGMRLLAPATISAIRGQTPTPPPAPFSCDHTQEAAECVTPVQFVPTVPPMAPASSSTTCPYLRQQAVEKQISRLDASVLENSVMENLEKLEQARHLYQEAETFRCNGFTEEARLMYQQVQRLCPGSRLDREAAERLRELSEHQPISFINKFTPSHFVSGLTPGSILTPDLNIPVAGNEFVRAAVEKQVDQLLRGCHNALVAGKHWQAAKLAREAQQLDADCVAAHPLVYKMNLLRQVEEQCLKQLPLLPFLPMVGLLNPAPSEGPPVAEQTLRPSLPSVDPAVVGALEKVLAETADPLPARLVVLSEEPGGSEEQEEPVLAWPSGTPPVDAPSLLGEPQGAEEETATEEETEDADGEDKAPEDLNSVLRDVIDSIRQGACVEIDPSREDGLRAQCEMQVGGVSVKVIWSSDLGCRCAVVRLLPEANPDLRAAQRVQNDAVIEWIRGLSSGAAAPAPAGEEPDFSELRDDADDDFAADS